MIKYFIFCICFLFVLIYSNVYSICYINGIVIDSSKKSPLYNANIILTKNDKKVYGSYSKKNGEFDINGIIPGTYLLQISYIGYKTFQKSIVLDSGNLDLGKIYLVQTDIECKEITVVADVPLGYQSGDTINFNASAIILPSNSMTEDLLNKLPGIQIENDGTIKAMGEQINTILIDGKPFFFSNPSLAIKNLPADLVDKIQIYDKGSDQSDFTGFDDGTTSKTINIITKASYKNSQFYQLYSGYRYPDEYDASGNWNIFHGYQRISIIGSSNDLNTFTSGYNKANSIGFNYNDNLFSQLEINGSYHLGLNSNSSENNIERDYLASSDSLKYYLQGTTSNSNNISHRFNFKMNWIIDSSNSIQIAPTITLQNSQTGSVFSAGSYNINNEPNNQLLNSNQSNSSSIDFSNNIIIRHKFNNEGRTISLSITSKYDNKQDAIGQKIININYSPNQPNNDSTITQGSSPGINTNIATNISYTDKIHQNGNIMLSYRFSIDRDVSDKRIYDYSILNGNYDNIDSSLSNQFDEYTYTNNLSANYSLKFDSILFQCALDYQDQYLKNMQEFPLIYSFNHIYNNLLPSFKFKYKLSQKDYFQLSYTTSTINPSVRQLQDVIDNSNPMAIYSGNSLLKPQYIHTITSRYSSFSEGSKAILNLFLSLNLYQNYISTSKILAFSDTTINNNINLLNGGQFNKPINMDGYINLNSSLNYSIFWDALKLSTNTTIGANYQCIPSMINNIINYSKNLGLNLLFSINSNINENIDFKISSKCNLMFQLNSINNNKQLTYNNYTNQILFKWVILDGFFIQSDVNNKIYEGLVGSNNKPSNVLNFSFGKKLFDNALEIKFSAFDILNQNKNISTTITDTYIEYSMNNLQSKYYLVSLKLNILNK